MIHLHVDLYAIHVLEIYFSVLLFFNTLPNDKILALTKLKTFADDKFDVAKILVSLCDRLENIVGKGENAGNQQRVGLGKKACLFSFP